MAAPPSKAASQWRRDNLSTRGLEIHGLREFQKELKTLADDGRWTKELAAANQQAALLVLARAKTVGRRRGGIHRKVAMEGLRAAREQRRAAIIMGGRGKEWVFGGEFGSHRHRQFPPFRGNQWDFRGLSFVNHSTGYVLHPAIRLAILDGSLPDLYLELIDDISRRAFPDGSRRVSG